jgi:hypothetical protein
MPSSAPRPGWRRLDTKRRHASKVRGSLISGPVNDAAGQFTTFDLPAYAESTLASVPGFALNYAAKSVTDPRSELGCDMRGEC